ncbi:hypothetical protein Val02_07420 [Virgisporangium aliadipatigenens]|uniref:DNA repair ATPase n=1 Tax=Virgisporangium aliadipatigenens TaxID=741659 RepID=A0A8J4DNI5_9ACTN|nr:DNA repair ATPase [Virgisporangium aliadipatigenens]GIJ43856.1 hypothetical protein Val02_07420 [Virgisporangium aliadipatigenens]
MTALAVAPVAAGGPDDGTYAVLRDRLAGRAAELARRVALLESRRVAEFGDPGLRLLRTGRLAWDGAATPVDIVAVDGKLLVGVRPRRAGGVDDVLRAYTVDGAPAQPAWLADERLLADVATLFRYFRDARLTDLRVADGLLLAVFRTGPDLRVLRWEVSPDGVRYLDDRGQSPVADGEPPWTRAAREDFVDGAVAAPGGLSVRVHGGQLTVSARPDDRVWSEPVDEPLQSLADLAVAWTVAEPLVLLRIRPYGETVERFLICHPPSGTVTRVDAVGQGCRLLPDGHGVVFPGGYHLATGEGRTFSVDAADLAFDGAVRAADGTDVLYAFRSPVDGRTLLMPYSAVRREVPAPLVGRGYALCDDGTLVLLRDDFVTQVWRTPFATVAAPRSDGPLARIGNADLAAAVADASALHRLAVGSTPAPDQVRTACARLLDRYHWLGDADVGDLRAPVVAVRDAAARVAAERVRVDALAAATASTVDAAAERVVSLAHRSVRPRTSAEWTTRIASLRRERAGLAALHDLPHADRTRLTGLADEMDAALAAAGRDVVALLSAPGGFAEQEERVGALEARAAAIAAGPPAGGPGPAGGSGAASATGVAAAGGMGAAGAAGTGPLAAGVAAGPSGGGDGGRSGGGAYAAGAAVVADVRTEADALRALGDLVGGLDDVDPAARADVLARTGVLLGRLNAVRTTLDAHLRELRGGAERAAFAAELALLRQAVPTALDGADTPDACDAGLTGLLQRLTDLDARRPETAPAAAVDDLRADVVEAFAERRQALAGERAERVRRRTETARRCLDAIRERTATLSTVEELDPLVARLRAVLGQLRDLGEAAAAEEFEGRLAAVRLDALRILRDRADLYAEDGTVRLGRHRFAVHTRPMELTLVADGDGTALVVSGTDYREPVRDPALAGGHRAATVPSESPRVYRAEYLAVSLLDAVRAGADPRAAVDEAVLTRLDEGYTRGVHDRDAERILRALADLDARVGLLRHPPDVRAAAQLFWAHGPVGPLWSVRARSLARAARTFDTAPAAARAALAREIDAAAGPFLAEWGVPAAPGDYLVAELAAGPEGFVSGRGARDLLDRFAGTLGPAWETLLADLNALEQSPVDRYRLAAAWLAGFESGPDLPEAVALLACAVPRYPDDTDATSTVDGLVGTHPRVVDGTLTLRLDEVLVRVGRFAAEEVPVARAYRAARREVLRRAEERLRPAEFRARVPDGFRRNRLVDEVYLPLVGENLARQLGAVGSGPVERSGLLMLVSPPGYGKTTLMEYVASRLGLLFIRVNGPALGHRTVSLDPARAPDAAAAREVEKVTFALELGTNVLLYVDDIQHTSPELLQRFVPLCDAQRRMEGVRDGVARTYDLRGRRFAVCLAGNPYTGHGERFRVPDMLTNRADVWNLGDVTAGRDDLFALSFLENALAVNPVLAPLSTVDGVDLTERARADDEIAVVLRHVTHARDVVRAVNRTYLDSATRPDGAPFLLQGSYRDLNAIAARILPVMDRAEVDGLVAEHYRGQAQTLTRHAAENLRRFAELTRPLSSP